MERYEHIIFVCTDNTCCSIMAEAVWKGILPQSSVTAESRGLIVLFPEPVNPKAVAVLKANRLEVSKDHSQALSEEDIRGKTLILTMTKAEIAQVKEKIHVPADVQDIGHLIGQNVSIEEPCGGTLQEYGALLEQINLAVRSAAEILFKETEEL